MRDERGQIKARAVTERGGLYTARRARPWFLRLTKNAALGQRGIFVNKLAQMVRFAPLADAPCFLNNKRFKQGFPAQQDTICREAC